MPVRHPTILVGCGAYGWNVLTGLLGSAADRGLLAWEEPGGGEGPSARKLKALSMLWVPDGTSPETDRDDTLPGTSHSPDVLSDLFLQIQRLGSGADLEKRFGQSVLTARASLLSSRVRDDDPERLAFGLDVIMIARPDQAALGRLERLLMPAMADLANTPNLVAPPGQDAQVLNFIQIFDFAHFWDRSAAGSALRADVKAWITRLSGRVSPNIGRIYLVDGKAAEAEHDDRWREEETALFLEFLLFEGLRGHSDLRTLYQRESFERQPIAAFGIRSIERSTGFLSHLAAAHFATGWLEYLATRRPPQQSDGHLRSLLATCRPESLEAELDKSSFVAIADQGLRTVEQDLLRIPMRSPTWVDELDRVARQGLRRVRRTLVDEARERARAVSKRRLEPLRLQLVAAATGALQDPGAPEPLAAVARDIEEVERALRDHEVGGEDPVPEPDAPLLEELRSTHRRYLQERAAMVEADGLRWAWPLMALLIAAGTAPIALEAIAELNPPDPALPVVVRRSIEILDRVASPAGVAIAIAIAVWAAGWGLFQPAIARRIDRSLRIFTDPERGRLADRVRNAVRGGPIRAAAQAQTLTVFREAAYRLRTAVMRELADVLEALRERRREMIWLREQMQEYLRMHGVEADAQGRLRLMPAGRSILRTFIDSDQSLDEILRSNPPTDDRYRDAQSRFKVFDGWREEYCDTFLYPAAFLDRLSTQYQSAVDQKLLSGDLSERQRLADMIVERLKNRLASHFRTGFTWSRAGAQAAPTTDTFCLLPEMWADLASVKQTLRDGNCQHVIHSVAPDRAYLLRLQDNIDPEWLV